MPRHLPPLLSIRAFEAAARLGGFARAADELCVTPGAVAHQIKLLEEWLGPALFVRRARHVELTDVGRAYCAQVGTLLDELERASTEVRRWSDDEGVTISALPSFVTRWLMPRLAEFRRDHPNVDVRVLASVPPVDFARDHVDLAIRLGGGPYAELVSTPLFAEQFVAVASPALLDSVGRPVAPDDVLRMSLLHDEYEARIPEQMSWARWFALRGISVPSQKVLAGLHFSHSYLTVEAAVAGQGVALQSDVLIQDLVMQGRLEMVCTPPVQGAYRYTLLSSNRSSERPRVQKLAAWLIEQAEAFEGRR
ncbi:transcriptional regulator GcvA [Paraburkholderia sediminicola]|uniref:transcriptional regulator GcvA n=1 Tax=Paraburkholderia sediminicola TaxID=458836 RepID=UPI0038BA693D